MSRRTILPVALFLLLSSVALPAPAATPGSIALDLLSRAWDFLDRLWPQAEGRGSRGIWAAAGSCINPDGKPSGAAACSAVIWSDGGVCIDPNGRPSGASCSAAAWSDNGSCIDPDGKPGAVGCTR